MRPLRNSPTATPWTISPCSKTPFLLPLFRALNLRRLEQSATMPSNLKTTPMSTLNKPQEIILSPGSIVTLSKTNAAAFHAQMKDMIKDTGYGLFEYVEVLKFLEKV